ncbi:SDR family NAD(P)-dependent oxidoreductase [Saccharospirillum salsuginis]|uniref:Short-chain dehydrogenase n=1 Tax=Saccharospirillum salsuginis TaxID=418750 RepID=A0A918KK19_9GAMM|nr:SDR family NAD(P)-dependent oxidoreductase [Saccharospirillum salsuginis]GGX66479.1 short-chain dehydrogenase [Saccharospirillum salsuginis]
MQLRNRTVFITGASSGIGRELAFRFAEKGCSVLLTGRDRERLTDTANAVSGTAIVADLTSPDSVRSLGAKVAADHPDVSILVNSAAIQINGLFSETDPDRLFNDIALETQVDFIAPIQLCGLLLPTLRQQSIRTRQPSAIVNLNSGLALAPKKSGAVYCATKSGLLTFNKAFRFQLEADQARSGADVRVMDVILPMVDTQMTAGRGTGKISAFSAATGIVSGVEAERNTLYIGKSKILRVLDRLVPELSGQMFRNA